MGGGTGKVGFSRLGKHGFSKQAKKEPVYNYRIWQTRQ
jgi:hypothetical protein